MRPVVSLEPRGSHRGSKLTGGSRELPAAAIALGFLHAGLPCTWWYVSEVPDLYGHSGFCVTLICLLGLILGVIKE